MMIVAVHTFSGHWVPLLTAKLLWLISTKLGTLTFLFMILFIFYFYVFVAEVAHSGSSTTTVFVFRYWGKGIHVLTIFTFTRPLHTVFSMLSQLSNIESFFAVFARCLSMELVLKVWENYTWWDYWSFTSTIFEQSWQRRMFRRQ